MANKKEEEPLSNSDRARGTLAILSVTSNIAPTQGMFTVAMAQAYATLAVEDQLKRIADELEKANEHKGFI